MEDELKPITKENCNEVCLLLWEELSSKIHEPIEECPEGENEDDWCGDNPGGIKQRVLNGLGYKVENVFACPLCEIHFEEKTCPLGDCSTGDEFPCMNRDYYAFGEWESVWDMDLPEAREFAEMFYIQLKRKFKVE